MIVPTRIRKIHFLCLGPIVVYREPKFDTLQEAAILLFLFKDFNTLYKRVNKALLFCICEFTVYFIKALKDAIDRVFGKLLLVYVFDSQGDGINLIFYCTNFLIQLIHALLHIIIFSVIEPVTNIKSVHLLSQFILSTDCLSKSGPTDFSFFFQLFCICFCSHFSFESILKLWVIDELIYNLFYGSIYFILPPLMMVATVITIDFKPMLACIIEEILIVCTVRFLFTINIGIHGTMTNRAP